MDITELAALKGRVRHFKNGCDRLLRIDLDALIMAFEAELEAKRWRNVRDGEYPPNNRKHQNPDWSDLVDLSFVGAHGKQIVTACYDAKEFKWRDAVGWVWSGFNAKHARWRPRGEAFDPFKQPNESQNAQQST